MRNALRTLCLFGSILAGAGCNSINKTEEYSTVFRYWLDGARNNEPNELIEPEELMGRDVRFKLSEEKQLCFGTRVKGHKDEKLYFSLIDSDDNIITEFTNTVKLEDYVSWVKYKSESIAEFITDKGEYTVVWEVADPSNKTGRREVDRYKVFLEK